MTTRRYERPGFVSSLFTPFSRLTAALAAVVDPALQPSLQWGEVVLISLSALRHDGHIRQSLAARSALTVRTTAARLRLLILAA